MELLPYDLVADIAVRSGSAQTLLVSHEWKHALIGDGARKTNFFVNLRGIEKMLLNTPYDENVCRDAFKINPCKRANKMLLVRAALSGRIKIVMNMLECATLDELDECTIRCRLMWGKRSV